VHQWDILSPGRKWDNLSDGTICLWGESGTFCLMGQFVSLKTPLGQFVLGTKCLLTAQETVNPPWPTLKSLKLGGMMTTGAVLKYLLEGCLNIRVLCYSLYEDQEHLVTDAFVEDLLQLNPMPALVAFYFEKCVLTEESFFLLVQSLPSLRFLGILSEWGLDRKGRLAIESYIRGNNLALDVFSVLDGSGYRLDSPMQDLANSLA